MSTLSLSVAKVEVSVRHAHRDAWPRLVDEVLPRVPYRQWVLSFPSALRLLFADRPDVLLAVPVFVTRAQSSTVIAAPFTAEPRRTRAW